MKKQIFKIFATLLILTLSMQMAVSATSTPPTYEQRAAKVRQPGQTIDVSETQNSRPQRPVVDTGTKSESFGIPTYIEFEDNSITIDLSHYDENNPYKAYYTIEIEGNEEQPLISIGNMCDNGYQIYGMTDEKDSIGDRYIAIYPFEAGRDRLVLSSQANDSIFDTLIINIVDNASSSRDKSDVIEPPSWNVDISGDANNQKPDRPVVDTTDADDYDEIELEYEVEEEVICEDPFIDVSSNYKYYDAVLALKAAGLINGYSNGTFKPNNTITRAEVCTMIVNTLENPHIISIKGNTFKDVSNHWAYDSVAKAKNMGLINGVNENEFAPNENITDEQIVKILVNLLGYGKNAPYLGGYPKGYLNIADDLGLLKGINVRIGNQTDRGTVTKMLYNALHCYNASEFELIKLPIENMQTVVIQTKPTNKGAGYEVDVEDDIDDKHNASDHEDEILEQENEIFKAVVSCITYISNNEALLIGDFIEECIKKGWTETPVEITSMAESYPEEALLEQLSDIYHKFN